VESPARVESAQRDWSLMLTLTPDAARLVRALTADAHLSPAAGLRIIIDPLHCSLSMHIATAPVQADSIVQSAGARVFLSPAAASRLDGRTLRADISPDRSAFFLDS
jgi:iron-sulfur cluster assembly protein